MSAIGNALKSLRAELPKEVTLVAVSKYHPIEDLNPERWNSQHLRTRYYTTRLHVGAFYLPAFLEEMLEEVEDK